MPAGRLKPIDHFFDKGGSNASAEGVPLVKHGQLSQLLLLLCKIVLAAAYRSGRITCHNRAGSDVLGHNASRPNNSAITDCNARHNSARGTHEDIVPDSRERDAGITERMLSARIMREYVHARGERHVIANGNQAAVRVIDDAPAEHVKIAAYPQSPRFKLANVRVTPKKSDQRTLKV